MKRPALIGLAIAVALLVLFGVASTVGSHSGPPKPTDQYKAILECGACN